MKTLTFKTNKSNHSGESVEFTVKSIDNGGEENGTIITEDYTFEFCERWDNALQEIVIDVTHDGGELCKVYDHGRDYCAILLGSDANFCDTNKFAAIVKLAYNCI